MCAPLPRGQRADLSRAHVTLDSASSALFLFKLPASRAHKGHFLKSHSEVELLKRRVGGVSVTVCYSNTSGLFVFFVFFVLMLAAE